MTECERIIQEGTLTPEFFVPEVRDGFYVSETRKKIWAVEIDMLLEFDRICRKHGLKYFLLFGSLLGAIRHKGFIPWDDDIDLGMMRDDYDKLAGLAGEFRHPYFLQTPYTDNGYFYSFMKLRNSNTAVLDKNFLFQGFNMGLPVDIFPVDNVMLEDYGQNFSRIEELIMANSTYMRLTNPRLNERDKKRVAAYKGGDPMQRYEKIQEIASQYKNEPAKYASCIVLSIYGKDKVLFHYEDFASVTYDYSFEGFVLPVPSGWDHVLSVNYGDYMRFPPVEERGEWHKTGIWFPDTSYINLLGKYMSDPSALCPEG